MCCSFPFASLIHNAAILRSNGFILHIVLLVVIVVLVLYIGSFFRFLCGIRGFGGIELRKLVEKFVAFDGAQFVKVFIPFSIVVTKYAYIVAYIRQFNTNSDTVPVGIIFKKSVIAAGFWRRILPLSSGNWISCIPQAGCILQYGIRV